MTETHEFINQVKDALREKRHQLHRIAEISGQEAKTANLISKWIKACNPSNIYTGVGGYGIIATFDSGKPGNIVVLRAELDALPIPESIEIEHASENPNVSHKCGHDGHMIHLIGVAEFLKHHPLKTGKVILLFQPAEETGMGAENMLNSDLFTIDSTAKFYALHNLPGFPFGSIILRNEAFASASAGISFKFHGKTAHAAQPETGISPEKAILTLMQTAESLRQKFKNDQGVVITLIHIKLGEKAFGTSPGEGEIHFTIRATKNEVLRLIRDTFLKNAAELANSLGLEYDFNETEVFKATVNNNDLVEQVESAAQSIGLDMITVEKPFRWSEDFGLFTEKFDGVLFGIGAGVNFPALHNYEYDYPDDLISTGVQLFLEILKENDCIN